MQAVITVATLLGGAAAVWFFWDKIVARLRPPPRGPGQSEPPRPVLPAEKWVDFDYPARAGIVRDQEAQGYRLAWCADNHLATRLDLEGWERVIVTDPQTGGRVILRMTDRPYDQTLVRHHEPPV